MGKAFGGVVALAILLVWWTNSERQRAADLYLVNETDPRITATAAFIRGDRVFYESWLLTHKDKDVAGEWRTPGTEDIPEVILTRYPERFHIERSWHLDLSQDTALFSRSAWRWATTYNRRLGELIKHFDLEAADTENSTP